MFILSTDAKPDGTTVITVDAGVTRRIQLVTLTETAHITTLIPMDQLIGPSLAIRRPYQKRNPSL